MRSSSPRPKGRAGASQVQQLSSSSSLLGPRTLLLAMLQTAGLPSSQAS